MKKMELTCVVCPNGCLLTVWQEDGVTHVEGAACKNGVRYGETELTDPRRVLTTSVAVNGGVLPLVSVRSTAPIPRLRGPGHRPHPPRLPQRGQGLNSTERSAPAVGLAHGRNNDFLGRSTCGTGYWERPG